MLKSGRLYCFLILLSISIVACSTRNNKNESSNQSQTPKTASQILGDSNYLAVCYGGYRHDTRDSQPSLSQIKEDMKLLNAMGIRILRTYNTHFQEATTILKAIIELQKENSKFEMYVMLGAWIDCENAWTGKTPNHNKENEAANQAEIERAIDLANKYPEIVKIILVGNEAMVKWQTSYFVQPKVILKWVIYLQKLKKVGKLKESIWITSSDNFASWGGGDSTYHCKDLEQLIKAVDFVSLHTYPMHDTHYNPSFWGGLSSEANLSKTEATELLMQRAVAYAQTQYTNTLNYIHSIDSTKQVHIGETGWASVSDGLYGNAGSKACDEYKAGIYYKQIRKWTNLAGISCFYFEAIDEHWKDAKNPMGSENHFGLINKNGEAKYAIWNWVDKGVFKNLTRDGIAIQKSVNGNETALIETVEIPLIKNKN